MRSRCDAHEYPLAYWPVALLADAITTSTPTATTDTLSVCREICATVESAEAAIPIDLIAAALCAGFLPDRRSPDLRQTLFSLFPPSRKRVSEVNLHAIRWFQCQAELWWQLMALPEYCQPSLLQDLAPMRRTSLIARAFDLCGELGQTLEVDALFDDESLTSRLTWLLTGE